MTTLFNLLYNLPEELLEIIWNNIDYSVKATLNKCYFKKYHSWMYDIIGEKSKLSMHREALRHDAAYVLNQVLLDSGISMLKIKNYCYKNQIYHNYLVFLLQYSHEHNANKCKNIINVFLKKSGLSINEHKKNRTKNIRWTN